MDIKVMQTFPLSVRWRTGWRKISGNCINTIFCRDSFCTCWTYHTRDHRSARLTFSTICIQFSNISRSQEKCITDVHFFGNMSWSCRSLLRDFPRTFLQMHPKVCRSKRGSQNTGNICMILCEGRFLQSVLFAKPLLPPLPGPSHHLMSGLQESDPSRTPCWNLFAWSTSVFSDSARPKPCCKALGCNQSETDLEKIPFSWKQKHVASLDTFGMLSLLQAAFFLSRLERLSKGMW